MCELCGNNSFEDILWSKDWTGAVEGKFRIVKCKKCGLIFQFPIPEKEEIKKFYSEEYYAYSPPSLKFLQRKVKKFKEGWRKKILQEKYGYPLGLPKSHNPLWKLPFFNYERKGVLPYVPKGKILDIGCGSGSILFFLKELGWDTYGVEISSTACKYAREIGLKVWCGELTDVEFPSEFFDVVRLNHVLEHIRNPRKTMEEIRRIIKPSGKVIVSIPNINGLGFRIFRDKWFGLDLPRHIFFFTPETIKLLAHKTKFKVERIIFHRGKGLIKKSIAYWLEEKKISPHIFLKNPIVDLILTSQLRHII